MALDFFVGAMAVVSGNNLLPVVYIQFQKSRFELRNYSHMTICEFFNLI